MKKLTLIPGTGHPVKTAMRFFSWITCVLFFAALFLSCKKDSLPNDPSKIPATEKQLTILFDISTIPNTLVDSTMVIFRKQGGANQLLKYFNKAGSNLAVVIDDLSKGEWTADITVFARASADTATRQYVQSKPFSVSSSSGDVTVTGPNGTLNDNWKPSVVLADKWRQVQVVLPLDNADPYFEVRLPDRSWKTVQIERSALYRSFGNELLAREIWTCNDNCFTHDNWIINQTAFAAYAQIVKQKNWNNGEIEVEISGNAPDKKLSFFYAYKK